MSLARPLVLIRGAIQPRTGLRTGGGDPFELCSPLCSTLVLFTFEGLVLRAEMWSTFSGVVILGIKSWHVYWVSRNAFLVQLNLISKAP